MNIYLTRSDIGQPRVDVSLSREESAALVRLLDIVHQANDSLEISYQTPRLDPVQEWLLAELRKELCWMNDLLKRGCL